MFSTEAFKKMKHTAILINTARGPVVDETTLVEAIKNGQYAEWHLTQFEDPALSKTPLAGRGDAVKSGIPWVSNS